MNKKGACQVRHAPFFCWITTSQKTTTKPEEEHRVGHSHTIYKTLFHKYAFLHRAKIRKNTLFHYYRLKTTLFLANKSFVCSVKGEVWEVVDDVHCLGADVDDGEEEVKDVARDRFKHFCDCSIDRCIQSIVVRLF